MTTVVTTHAINNNPWARCAKCAVPQGQHQNADHEIRALMPDFCPICGEPPIQHSPEEGLVCHEAGHKKSLW
jgi:hypothetical protein